MATVAFDTLKFVEKLKSAGVSEAQAKAEAEALQEAFGTTAELATKRGLERLEAKLDARFERIDGELRLNRWMLGVIVVAEAMPLLAKLFQPG
jgi:hypothetical protein